MPAVVAGGRDLKVCPVCYGLLWHADFDADLRAARAAQAEAAREEAQRRRMQREQLERELLEQKAQRRAEREGSLEPPTQGPVDSEEN